MGPRRLLTFLCQMQRLFEGGAFSGAALIRVNTVPFFLRVSWAIPKSQQKLTNIKAHLLKTWTSDKIHFIFSDFSVIIQSSKFYQSITLDVVRPLDSYLILLFALGTPPYTS